MIFRFAVRTYSTSFVFLMSLFFFPPLLRLFMKYKRTNWRYVDIIATWRLSRIKVWVGVTFLTVCYARNNRYNKLFFTRTTKILYRSFRPKGRIRNDSFCWILPIFKEIIRIYVIIIVILLTPFWFCAKLTQMGKDLVAASSFTYNPALYVRCLVRWFCFPLLSYE